MTYRDYMMEHEDAGFEWCKIYIDKSEDYALLLYDGDLEAIMSPKGEFLRTGYYGTLTKELTEEDFEEFVREVNPEYDMYSGYNDLEIALQVMHKAGCYSCPWFHECEHMGEEIDAEPFEEMQEET